MKDYSQYSLNELLGDKEFVVGYFTDGDAFLEDLVKAFPEKADDFRKAFSILGRLKISKPEVKGELIQSEKGRIRVSIRKTIIRRRSRVICVTCMAASILVIAMLWLFSNIHDNFPLEDSYFLGKLYVEDSIFREGNSLLYYGDEVHETFSVDPCIDLGTLCANKRDSICWEKIIVGYGQHAEIKFRDGTVARVNSGSVIVFPEKFKNEERKIYVSGEIFLEVKPDENCPFIVKTRDMSVKVAGTSFNVRSYSNEDEESVVLVSGKVEVVAKEGDLVHISPNERFSQKEDSFSVSVVDVDAYISWREDKLQFINAPLSYITRQLSRRYNVKIICDVGMDLTCSGILDLNRPFEEVLRSILETAQVDLNRISNDTYLITHN